MKIEMRTIPTGTIEEFAEANGLTMVVGERDLPVGNPTRYYAEFDHSEIKDGCCLCSMYGNGSTPEEAIAEYAKNISMKRMVLYAMCNERREINVWRLT
jgi:hypothetical protein